MPRTSRFVLRNVVHHVTARGVDGRSIFESGYDKDKYLKRFATIAEEEKVLVNGFCLMKNHVHWLLTPTTDNGLARLFQRVHTWWAIVFNRKNGRRGHLFQSRYYSSPLDEDHYWKALRYVELNPKKAGLVARPNEWEHSSAQAHVSGQADSRIDLSPVVTRKHFAVAEWQAFLGADDDRFDQTIRRATSVSRPSGDSAWIADLERQYSRRLAILPPGRPRISIRTLSAG